MEAAIFDVEFDGVAIADECNRAAGCGFGADVKDYGAEGGAAHACVGNADHVGDAAVEKFLRKGHVADFGHAGITHGAAILQDEDGIFVDVEIGIGDAFFVVLDGTEDDGASAMLHEFRSGGGGF